MQRWSIANAKILTPDRVIESGHVVIDQGRIASVDAGAPQNGGRVVDAAGAVLTPGLIDIHIHGCGGFWGFFNQNEILDMAKYLLRFGVTAFCPTTVTLPQKSILDAVAAVRGAMAEQAAGRDYEQIPAEAPDTGARILGINIEGPYINRKMRGAHVDMCIRDPEKKEIDEILDAAGPDARIMTLAPELPGGMDTVEQLCARGVVVSVGHSDADREQALEAADRGANLATHLFNQHRAFHHREPGVAFTLLQRPGVFCELIVDGVHTHPDTVRMAARLSPASELVLITDAISAAGLEPGKYQVWGLAMEVKGGVAQLEDGTFAGSVLTLNRAVANMAKFAQLPLEQSLGMATHNPAVLLGLLPHAGRIAPGATADLALFDTDMNCLATILAGHVAYCTEDSPL